jgi:hypothetical protein
MIELGANLDVVVGLIGVGLLLVAFALNLFGVLKFNSKLYVFLNFIGAYLSCYASVLINYFPFVILEGTWSLVAFVRLIFLLMEDIRK